MVFLPFVLFLIDESRLFQQVLFHIGSGGDKKQFIDLKFPHITPPSCILPSYHKIQFSLLLLT